LMNGDKARNTAALLIFATNRMARTLWSDHNNVNGLFRLDKTEMNVETMCESNRSTITKIVVDMVLIDVSLKFVGRRHHHKIGPFSRISNIHNLKAICFGFSDGGGSFTKSYANILGA